MKNCLFLCLLLCSASIQAQDPGAEKSKCDEKTRELASQINQLNDEWEKSKADLRAGLFCSKCNQSKTILDKTEGFYKHLANVKGEPIPATQQQMDKAYESYLNKYNSLKSRAESNNKSCVERYNSAVQRINDQNQRKAEQDYNDKLRAAEQARREEEARQAAELERQRQEAERQKQETLNAISQTTDMLQQSFNNNANRLKQEIGNINIPTEKITANKNTSVNGGIKTIDKNKKVKSVDDFDFEEETQKSWRDAAAEYAKKFGFNKEDENLFADMNEGLQNTDFTSRVFDLFKSQKDNVKNYLKDKMRDRLEDFLEENDLPSTSADRNLDRLIDGNSSGQVKRNLHFVKDYLNDISDRTTTLVGKALDDDAMEYDFDGRKVFLDHSPTLFGLPNAPTMQDVYQKVKDVVTDKRVIVSAAAWVFAPQIALPTTIIAFLAK